MVQGRALDIHNNFDFRKFEFAIVDDEITLSWLKTEGDWVAENEVNGFDLVFHGIQLFKVEGKLDGPNTESLNLSHFGYLHPDDFDVMDGCLDEHESELNYPMIFVFSSGLSLKLYAKKVSFIEKP